MFHARAGRLLAPDRRASLEQMDSGDFPGVLREALRAARYEERQAACARARAEGRLAGIGLACYVEGTALGPFEGATVRIDATGRVVLVSEVSSEGQGSRRHRRDHSRARGAQGRREPSEGPSV